MRLSVEQCGDIHARTQKPDTHKHTHINVCICAYNLYLEDWSTHPHPHARTHPHRHPYPRIQRGTYGGSSVAGRAEKLQCYVCQNFSRVSRVRARYVCMLVCAHLCMHACMCSPMWSDRIITLSFSLSLSHTHTLVCVCVCVCVLGGMHVCTPWLLLFYLLRISGTFEKIWEFWPIASWSLRTSQTPSHAMTTRQSSSVTSFT